MKEDNRFRGWCFPLTLAKGKILTEHMALQDGNIFSVNLEELNMKTFETRRNQSICQLAYAVLMAGADTLERSGEQVLAKAVKESCPKFFKRYILAPKD
ncbi:MAG: hypothetical protein SD837_18160 [Candidatus Electrothrix scaldis]|nr:MAG: hypothetical protein SD837_18160 [Candidatus Electrothrix sp. GW3-3]